MDGSGRHLVYSVAKTVLGVLCLRLDLDLEAPIATWVDDGRLPRTSLRQLLNDTSGIPDYGRLTASGKAVRDSPGEPTRRLLLSGDERVDVQAQALDELSRATGCTSSAPAHSSGPMCRAPRS